ncbi:protein mono-ADP-ribosyltransferase PARP4 isoform X2 [Limanda limanda]|uniref:protein mono-ADP-ribosyltransferase PARP4 isoform X2 n=1 Tax=Limanda limanda TaxID=27771 RepID=UPI0029C810F5|nr:protein mono-ADP-ribosyltransferase PARP4 isoform X2 [Limanda limanda]
MAVFENSSVLLDLKNLSYKEKKKLKSAVTENGGNVSFVVNKQCTLIVTSDVSNLSCNRLRSIQKHQTPVVGVDYVYGCLQRGTLLPVEEFKLDTSPPAAFSPPLPLSSLKPAPFSSPVSRAAVIVELPKGQATPVDSVGLTPCPKTPGRSGKVLDKFRIYTETDSDLPSYPKDFQVAKYSIFEKINRNTLCVLELQSFKGEKGRQYCVVQCWKSDVEAKKELVFLATSEEAVDVYQALRETSQAAGLQPRRSIPPQSLGLASFPLQQLLLEEKLNTGCVSREVGVFVELLWTEALGQLSLLLSVPISKLSLNDVSRAEGLLLQAQRKLKEGKLSETVILMNEINNLLPQGSPLSRQDLKEISQRLDLCQLIRDILNVSEMSLRGPAPSSLGKYRALRCSIETVPPGSSDFQAVTSVLSGSKLQIQQILRVGRGVELQSFKSELGNVQMLLHSSSPSNFVGILSRGLLLPHAGVEHHGIERTDVGYLGSGIYFSDAVSTTLKYSRPSVSDGSRLLLVCDVALGSCRNVHKRDVTLTKAPEGHHSVHGVRCTPNTHSEFEDDEYVVYSPDQVKLKYVVQFSIEGEELREFSPAVDTSAEPCPPPSLQVLSSEDVAIEDVKNPLEEVKAGLLDSSGQRLPLQSVHVKCKLIDLLSQVIIFQEYTNNSSVSIEAKYVFPLDDSAAVCGFEAFINGKHVVGKVKEKETARKEYKQAIEKGHGAYLMDQDAPDVFTISVGNLPPGASVLIKVTFVSELIVRDGSILFSLPGSVAPWQESAALNQTTQVTLEKVCVTDESADTREFSLDMSVEMPNEILSLDCITHKVKVKRTDCKAVVAVLPGQVMGPEGFQLSVSLSEVHLPRMWVEKHPDKDSQACMLVFYPDFDVSSMSESDEVFLLLDTSESMNGESLRMAQRIALQVLRALGSNIRLNVVLFGSDHTEAFLTAQPLTKTRQTAESFLKNVSPVGGSTELWRPLRALSLLPPSRGIRNLLLLSDGHIQNAEFTLKLLRDNVQHSRLFTCGISPTANKHMLRALAQAGGGAYEFFDTKVKHSWSEKVDRQVKRVAAPGCSSVSVKWQQFNPTAPTPVQAPKQLHALFNDCHTLVYGFVPHCTQATLHGNLSGQELETMVSTSELQKTRGTFLHKLTARALIRDYEDGSLDTDEAEHEGKKAELKSYIVELSKEFSILSQFTSFVAIEERDPAKPEEGFTDIPQLIAEEDVDFLPYISWNIPQDMEDDDYEEMEMEAEVYDPPLLGSIGYGEVSDLMTAGHERMRERSSRMLHHKFRALRRDYGDASLDTSEDEEEAESDLMTAGHERMREGSRRMIKARPLSRDYEDGSLDTSEDEEEDSCSSDDYVGSSMFSSKIEAEKPFDRPSMDHVEQTPSSSFHPPPPRRSVGGYSRFAQIPSFQASAIPPPFALTSNQASLILRSQQKLIAQTPIKASQVLPPPPFALTSPFIGSLPSSSAQTQIQASPMPPPPLPSRSYRVCSSSAWTSNKASSVPPPPPPPFALHSIQASPTGSLPSPFAQTPIQASPMPPPPPPCRSHGVYSSFALTSIQASPMPPPPPPPFALTSIQASPVPLPPPPPPPFALHSSQASQICGSLPSPFAQTPIQASPVPQPPPPPFMACETSLTAYPKSKVFYGRMDRKLAGRIVSNSYTPRDQSLTERSLSRTNSSISPLIARKCSSWDHLAMSSEEAGPPLKKKGFPSLIQALQQPDEECGRALSGLISLSGLKDARAHIMCSSALMDVRKSLERGGPAPLDLSDNRPFGSSRRLVGGDGDRRHKREVSNRVQQVQHLALGHFGMQMGETWDQTADLQLGRRPLYHPATAAHQMMLKWEKIFQMQHSEGYWELTTELGAYLNVNVDSFVNVFLKNKGICSLGVRAHAEILRLVATLLVLQMMREEKLEEGKLLRTLFCLDDSAQPRPQHWGKVKKAVEWVRWADKQYPCIYSRLEFGWSWESSTRQLLGYEGLPPFSPLNGFVGVRKLVHYG